MMAKILIAVPSMDQVSAQFAQSLAQLQKAGDCTVAFQIGSLVYTSRDGLSQIAINQGCDYVFWLDSDMIFPPETLRYMLKEMEEKDLDFLSGLYFRRVPPFTPVLFSTLEMKNEMCFWTEWKDVPEGLVEIGGCGFGCVLMKTEMLIAVQARFQAMFTPMLGVGEDLSFCWRARQCGYKLYADTNILLGHVGHQVITKQFYDIYKGAKQNAGESQTGDEADDDSV